MANGRIHGIVNIERKKKKNTYIHRLWNDVVKYHTQIYVRIFRFISNCKTTVFTITYIHNTFIISAVVIATDFQLKISNVPLKEPIFNFWSMK